MKTKKEDKKNILESIKIEKGVVDLVREHKKKTYMPIGEFFKIAALKELKLQSK